MLNHTILVGRLVKEPEVYETETGKKVMNIILAVPRNYKNAKGEYDTDFIPCTLWQGIAENTKAFCSKGDLLGIKGHIQTRSVEQEDETYKYYVEVIAEKVSFLSSLKKEN